MRAALRCVSHASSVTGRTNRPISPTLFRRYSSSRRYAEIMPCLILIFVLAFPRVMLVLMFLFSNYLERAYHGYLLPLLGFVFLPLTTIVYAWLVNTKSPIEGLNLIFLVLAVLLDAGGLGGGAWHRRRRL